ncbi:MAG: DUF1244 domain-containing protein [Pseudomonadota bacterium]
MENAKQQAAEAAAFRRLLSHLQHRTDVQNIDLMGLGGFCRNCLSDWFQEAMAEQGDAIDKPTARRHVYGMPYDDYKAQYQTPATDQQLAAMKASVAKNKAP